MPSRLVVFAGLPGVGKSTLSLEVARRTGAIWLRVDVVEAALIKSGFTRSFESGLAAYVVARDLAGEHLRIGRTVVVDAVNGVEPARAMWRSLAAECGSALFFFEAFCSDLQEHRRRVESRGAPTPPLPVPAWDEVVRREYEPWTDPVTRVDTCAPVEVSVGQVLARIQRAGPSPDTTG
jgi:predicted kinase